MPKFAKKTPAGQPGRSSSLQVPHPGYYHPQQQQSTPFTNFVHPNEDPEQETNPPPVINHPSSYPPTQHRNKSSFNKPPDFLSLGGTSSPPFGSTQPSPRGGISSVSPPLASSSDSDDSKLPSYLELVSSLSAAHLHSPNNSATSTPNRSRNPSRTSSRANSPYGSRAHSVERHAEIHKEREPTFTSPLIALASDRESNFSGPMEVREIRHSRSRTSSPRPSPRTHTLPHHAGFHSIFPDYSPTLLPLSPLVGVGAGLPSPSTRSPAFSPRVPSPEVTPRN